ncbi:MAG: gas vesicle protein [Gemmatimonadota bacterium]
MADERPARELTRVEAEERLGMVELVHRVLDRGALIHGDVIISVAGIDLVYVGLRVLLASAETMRQKQALPLRTPGRRAAGRDAAGRDAAGRDAAGRDAAGRDAAGRDAAGRDAAGQDDRARDG